MKTVIGSHAITLGSVEGSQVEGLFSPGEKAHILYSDPPWGEGNMKYWATMAEKMTGSRPNQMTFDGMLDRFGELIRGFCTGFVFVEQGMRFEEQTVGALQKAGVTVSRIVQIRYGSGKNTLPNILICGSVNGQTPTLPEGVEGMKGAKLPYEVVKCNALPGGIVLDPCCGMGYTAKAAVRNNMIFRGNEFNSARLAKTEKFLRSKVKVA